MLYAVVLRTFTQPLGLAGTAGSQYAHAAAEEVADLFWHETWEEAATSHGIVS